MLHKDIHQLGLFIHSKWSTVTCSPMQMTHTIISFCASTCTHILHTILA